MFYDRQGRPISFDEYAQLIMDRSYKVLAQIDVDGVLVSTVWLGLDHGWSVGGAPLIFETMTFEGDWLGVDQWRYSTEADALAGHERVVLQVRLQLAEIMGEN